LGGADHSKPIGLAKRALMKAQSSKVLPEPPRTERSNAFATRLSSVILWDAQEGVLRRHALVSADGTRLDHSPDVMLRDDARAMKTFRTRKTQVYHWSDVEALGEEAITLMTRLGLRSVCCVPLQTARDCHGVLMVGRPDDAPYSPADVALLEQVGHPLAARRRRGGSSSPSGHALPRRSGRPSARRRFACRRCASGREDIPFLVRHFVGAWPYPGT
jgi:hypothetical protein